MHKDAIIVQCRELRKQLKGINPKLSLHKKLTEELKALETKLS